MRFVEALLAYFLIAFGWTFPQSAWEDWTISLVLGGFLLGFLAAAARRGDRLHKEKKELLWAIEEQKKVGSSGDVYRYWERLM